LAVGRSGCFVDEASNIHDNAISRNAYDLVADHLERAVLHPLAGDDMSNEFAAVCPVLPSIDIRGDA
jgi:hypothetical protein